MWRERALKIELVLVGLLFTAGLLPLVMSLRSANRADYGDDMMLSLYVTLGIFLLIAARNPSEHRSLIAFTAWSSFAHAAVMAVIAYQSPSERMGIFVADTVLCVIGVTLIALAPARPRLERPAEISSNLRVAH
jgi:hypothetical protein